MQQLTLAWELSIIEREAMLIQPKEILNLL